MYWSYWQLVLLMFSRFNKIISTISLIRVPSAYHFSILWTLDHTLGQYIITLVRRSSNEQKIQKVYIYIYAKIVILQLWGENEVIVYGCNQSLRLCISNVLNYIYIYSIFVTGWYFVTIMVCSKFNSKIIVRQHTHSSLNGEKKNCVYISNTI